MINSNTIVTGLDGLYQFIVFDEYNCQKILPIGEGLHRLVEVSIGTGIARSNAPYSRQYVTKINIEKLLDRKDARARKFYDHQFFIGL